MASQMTLGESAALTRLCITACTSLSDEVLSRIVVGEQAAIDTYIAAASKLMGADVPLFRVLLANDDGFTSLFMGIVLAVASGRGLMLEENKSAYAAEVRKNAAKAGVVAGFPFGKN
jgi:hypothetical protein